MKGQIDVDLVLSYIIFVFFLGFVVTYINQLTTPFIDTTNYYILEKKIMSIGEMASREVIHENDFDVICHSNYTDALAFKITNTITGIKLPSNSTPETKVYDPGGDIYIDVYGNTMNLSFGSSGATHNVNASMMLAFPGFQRVNYTLYYNESGDAVNYYEDLSGTKILDINFTFTNDTDMIYIRTSKDTSVVALRYIDFNLSNIHIDGVQLQQVCGVGRKSNADKNSFTTYSLFEKGEMDLLSKIDLEAWLR